MSNNLNNSEYEDWRITDSVDTPTRGVQLVESIKPYVLVKSVTDPTERKVLSLALDQYEEWSKDHNTLQAQEIVSEILTSIRGKFRLSGEDL